MLSRRCRRIADGVALAAAPALVDIVAAATEESDRAALDRAALLLARLLAEAVLDPASVYGAAFAGERFEAYIATALVTEAAQRGEMLTWAHALSYACLYAHHGPAVAHGYTVPSTGAGRTANDTMNIVSLLLPPAPPPLPSRFADLRCCLCYFFLSAVAQSTVCDQWIDADPMVSKKRMPSDDAPGQMLTLLAELLRSGELPELAIGGAWHAAYGCVLGRPGLGPLAIELGLFELAVEHLRAIGSPADALSVSRGKAGRAGTIITVPYGVMRGFAGKTARPDLELCVSSGLFDFCLDFITAFAAAGVAGVKDSNPGVVCMAMGVLTKCGSQAAAEAKIRGAARALTFCLEPDHDLDYLQDIGVTSSAMAARLCCSVFGRDEGGCEFTFTQQHIGAKNATFCAIYIQNVSVYQDRLGTNIGKIQKRVAFFGRGAHHHLVARHSWHRLVCLAKADIGHHLRERAVRVGHKQAAAGRQQGVYTVPRGRVATRPRSPKGWHEG